VKIPALYLDTSVIGGRFDEEFKAATRELFRQTDLGLYQLFVSVVTESEIQNAPAEIQKFFIETFADARQILPLTEESEQLARAYVAAGIVTANYLDDARHVAIATVEQVGLVVSWNFKHLANYRRETEFNRVNRLQGYRSVRILTPMELIYGDPEEKI
jgi:predicted nucleic acid-binding protein